MEQAHPCPVASVASVPCISRGRWELVGGPRHCHRVVHAGITRSRHYQRRFSSHCLRLCAAVRLCLCGGYCKHPANCNDSTPHATTSAGHSNPSRQWHQLRLSAESQKRRCHAWWWRSRRADFIEARIHPLITATNRSAEPPPQRGAVLSNFLRPTFPRIRSLVCRRPRPLRVRGTVALYVGPSRASAPVALGGEGFRCAALGVGHHMVLLG